MAVLLVRCREADGCVGALGTMLRVVLLLLLVVLLLWMLLLRWVLVLFPERW